MDPLLNVLREAGQASLALFTFPYFYIAIALVWLHARMGVTLQRKLFHVRLYGAAYLTLTRLIAGVIVGIVLSLVGLGAGSGFTSETLMFIWIAMGILALFRLRYICLAYAAGALGLLQALSSWTGIEGTEGVLAESLRILSAIDVPGLLFLAGILHIAEGFLVRLQGSKQAIPLFLLGKRGKPMGAYALTGVWPIPLLWLIPAASDGFTLPWIPLFGGGGEGVAWSLLAFPVLIGFSDRTSAFWPEEKARASGNTLMIYGAVIAALAVGTKYWSPLVVVTAIAAFVLHEGLLWFSRSRENGRVQLYSQDGKGVKVLAVLPNTPASELGFQPGELIKKVNGAVVRNKEQLHAAMQRQAAFCKLEVVNRDGHIKFLQRARYEGEHYQLGLIMAPDEDVEFVAAPRSASIWQGLREAGARRLGNSPTMLARRQAAQAAEELAAAEESVLAAAELEEPEEDPGLPPRSIHYQKKP
ncbi:PDZ domain-containing protein [Cohnella abietis]|uniref:Cell division topological determinant MinJ n=1 Tax=Cohnella abietis TaxID=2507935 RepID=A0A3T1DD80_9BACL|nr:PDZ domain-containing protein [Cohnella abietis]BBI36106.1 cell division topological determinant MinJ [Cohnella abietis]